MGRAAGPRGASGVAVGVAPRSGCVSNLGQWVTAERRDDVDRGVAPTEAHIRRCFVWSVGRDGPRIRPEVKWRADVEKSEIRGWILRGRVVRLGRAIW